ncbi:DNA primase family protein [Kitasatospora sp. NPDC003701]
MTDWNIWRARLESTKDIRHVSFAQFVAWDQGADLRHVRGLGWYRWTGAVWEDAEGDGAALQAITLAARTLLERGESWAADAASKMLVHRERKGIVAEMAVLPELSAVADDFDARNHLLAFKNGTVDLRSGLLRPHDRADMITQCAEVAYDPDAGAPRWLQFVEEVFPGNPELQAYVQAFLGYAITGEVREHVLGVWYGAQGRNGKGTIVRTLQAVFGTALVHEVPFETFEKAGGSSGPHTEVMASMRPARIVVAQEGNPGTRMNTALLKNVSGGDRLSARHLYGRQFSYAPRFSLVLCTNHLPEFTDGGAALWARTRAVLFGESFAGRVDLDLEPTIQGPEAEGVAAWVVAGAVRYYDGGLVTPGCVDEATAMHRDQVNPLHPLVGDLFDFDGDAQVKRSVFNSSLKEWRSINGEDSGKFKPSWVKRELERSGVAEVKDSTGAMTYRGIRLTPEYGGPARTAEAVKRDTTPGDPF